MAKQTTQQLQQEKIQLLESLIVGHQLTEAALRDKIHTLEQMITLYDQAFNVVKEDLDRRQRGF